MVEVHCPKYDRIVWYTILFGLVFCHGFVGIQMLYEKKEWFIIKGWT